MLCIQSIAHNGFMNQGILCQNPIFSLHKGNFMKTPKSILAMLLIFGSMMGIVIATAYTRRSGNTGIDVAKIHQARFNPDSTLNSLSKAETQ